MRRLVLVSIIATLVLLFATPPAPSVADVSVGIGIGVNIGPPPLPVYVQPPVPGPNYIWTPGYWAWGHHGYYWVPGTWVLAPAPGLLWTPGYWGWDDGLYVWYPGYWGEDVGFYGGVVYGFGYFGVGYVGGDWDGDIFRYNTAVTNVNRTIVHNVYFDKTVVVNRTTINRASYNGGPHGIRTGPTWFGFERHDPQTVAQAQNQRVAAANRNYLASVNHGHPDFAAVDRPLSHTNYPGNFAAIRPHDHLGGQQHYAAHSHDGAYPQTATHTHAGAYQAAGHPDAGLSVKGNANPAHAVHSQSGGAPHGH